VFGSRPRARSPVLLILVYGAFLALVGITAAAQALMVTAHFSVTAINDIVGSDAATTRAFFNAYVKAHYFESGPFGPTPAELSALEAQLATLVKPGEMLRIEIRRPDGRIVASNDSTLRNVGTPMSPDFARAAAGEPRGAIVLADASEAAPGALGAPEVLREYLPIVSGQDVRAVVGIWRDAAPILDRLAAVRRDIVVVTLSAAGFAAVLLFLIFRSAQGRLSRQTTALIESSRRDVLTGTLNHGALVEHLANEIERARTTSMQLGVALLDIDNFRLLNDNHGHRAGDEALLAIVNLLRQELPAAAVFGRYGPDEFLVVASETAADDLPPAIGALHTAVGALSLQFESTERMPITISAGLCTYPEHGASVTVLLATAAQALADAKASGGDAVRTPDASVEGTHGSGFDVLQGLVIAVDTKDRYTKRHSEDVARYAVFLAERLGLDEELIKSIRLSGLLHDVGKIGVPDRILRKPGRLTAEEHEIIKQHVALGDMIVRDLPGIDVVRAGIRYHHERWDGRGYLSGLEADAIPLIARILAVGDTFSAMTTTRPYRKALGVREALTRLVDASGTQLEEDLVRAFVEGLETDANAPLPDNDRTPRMLWPLKDVA
jgi:diguanylate cyclase (GGDEF)-like protein/putative nucleotidyltransferase with HDIG domain